MERDTRFEELNCLYTPEQQVLMANQPAYLWMATKCVKLAKGKDHFLIRQRDGRWLSIDGAVTASRQLLNEWGGVQVHWHGNPLVINGTDVQMYVRGDGKKGILPSWPVVSGTMMVPTTDALAVSYRGNVLLNTWLDTVMPGDANAMNDPVVREYVTLIMRMVREGLCGMEDALGWEDMLKLLHERSERDIAFRFVMSWDAAIIQNPGINLQTNLWHIGPNEGCGKGTKGQIMQRIMGGQLVGCANADEFFKGWTDQIPDKLLNYLNEVGRNPRKEVDYDSFTKQYCNEIEITTNKRFLGVGPGPLPNFCNWCFTTNIEHPIRLSESDRRNAMFPTSNDRAKNVMAEKVATLLVTGSPDLVYRVLQGYAFILHSIKVEHDLIARPVENELREENKISGSNSGVDECLYWLTYDNGYEQDKERRASYFQELFNAASPEREPVSARMMQAWLSALRRRGEIQGRSEKRGKRLRWWFLVPSANFPRDADPGHASQRKTQEAVKALRLVGPLKD